MVEDLLDNILHVENFAESVLEVSGYPSYCWDIRQINLLGGQGGRFKLTVRWQAWIHLSPMRRMKNSETVSGTGLRGGNVKDEVDGFDTTS